MSEVQEFKSYVMLGILKETKPQDISTLFLQLNGNEKEFEKLTKLVNHADYGTIYDKSGGPIEVVVIYFDDDIVFTEAEMRKLCSIHIATLDHTSELFTYLDGKFTFDFTLEDIEKMSGTDAAYYLHTILSDGSIYNYWKQT